MVRTLATTIVLAIGALTIFAGTTQAARLGAVSIELIRNGADLAEVSWSATGAIDDGGTWTTENRHFGGSDRSNAFVVTQVLTTHVGAKGSFHLRFQGVENHVISFSGDWELYGGTGAYAGLTGTGHWYAADDPATDQLDFFLTGFVR